MQRRGGATVTVPQHERHFQHDNATDQHRHRDKAAEILAQYVDIDIEHHHHKQEQHHHRADVDQHQQDGEELGLQQHPDRRGAEERQHQKQCRLHRIAGGNHFQPRHHKGQ